MPVHLNALLAEAGIAPSKVRLLRHQESRMAKRRTPYELWRDDRAEFENYQAGQNFRNRSKLKGEYWASFVVTPGGETMLAGFYACRYLEVNSVDRPWHDTDKYDSIGTCDVYALTIEECLSDLSGRLIIAWGESERAWIQRADNQNKVILEIREEFKEPDFPGFGKFITSLSKVERLPVDWVTTLSSSRGIYLLTCPDTREQYVGSATGTGGFYRRWISYVHDGHGGNVKLKSRNPSDYQVSILEVAGSSVSREEILAMEVMWMRKLQSYEMGLNSLGRRQATN